MRQFNAYVFILLALLFFPLSVFAKTILLYEEPKDNAKQIGSLDTNIGIIAIFTPEKSSWMKVADPRDGKVGWIKTKDLDASGSAEYTFTQRFINSGNSPQSYQMIQFGNAPKMTPEEIQEQLKKTQQQQLLMQENLNKAMQNLLTNPWYNPNAPFLMPVIIVPAQNLPAAVPSKAADKSDPSKAEKKTRQ